jgi:type IX secretion system PorP/SprF family membrane protein
MKRLILIFWVSISMISYAQQMPQTTVYGYNMYAVNPAYAGINSCTHLAISHLNQWVKVDGAPATSMITVNTSLGNRFGIGGQLLIDKIGMLQQFSGMGTLSYGMKFGEHRLRAGLSVGYNQYRLNPSSAIVFDPVDPIVMGGNQAAGALNTDLGLVYQFQNLELAAATKQLIHSYSNFGYTNSQGYGLRRHFTGYAGYNISINPNWSLKPSVFLKGINHVLQADINTSATYKNFLNFGIGLRTQVGLIGRIGITVKDKFMFGYAYEAPMANMASYSSGSHELIMTMQFCKQKKEKISAVKTKIDTVERIIYKDLLKIDTVFITKTDTIIIDNSISKNVPEKEVFSGSLSKTILFEFDKSLVKKESFGELESMVNLLQANPTFKLSLEGHTDALGSEVYNVDLSKNRVNAVKDFLIMNGINADRIIIKHFGETQPKTSNDTPLGRQDNRRVDVMIIK